DAQCLARIWIGASVPAITFWSTLNQSLCLGPPEHLKFRGNVTQARLARLLMCSLFIWDAVLQLRNPAATVDYFTSLKLSCSDWQTDRRLAVVDLSRFFPATDGRIDCCRLLIDDYHSAANRRASLACVTFP
ncbi:MAG: hypothetical protein WB689_37415, partial [Xanthobacteraceae bacterium]